MYIGWRNILRNLSTADGRNCKPHRCAGQMPCAFFSRCLQRLQTEDAYTAAWLKLWNSHFYIAAALHMRTIPTRFPYLRLYFHGVCYMITALRHTTGKYHSTSICAHLLTVKHDAPKCGYSYSAHTQSGQTSGGTNILFQSTT